MPVTCTDSLSSGTAVASHAVVHWHFQVGVTVLLVNLNKDNSITLMINGDLKLILDLPRADSDHTKSAVQLEL